jgi:hypothetical protein
MKKVLLLPLICFSFIACRKTKTGDVTFWQAQGSGYDVTVVSLNGVSSNITDEYISAPDCGSSGCAVFNGLEVGNYSYTATDGTDNWSGTVEVIEGCKTVKLY